jgi:hypothetical protein
MYGAAVEYAPELDTTEPLPAAAITRIQQIIGTLLYYSIAVDPNMLVALGTITITATQSQGTTTTAQAVVQLLNYTVTLPHATICCHASDMILYFHSDASYISTLKAQSRAGWHFS